MGDSSSSTTQQSQTTPWAAAMPTVNNLFNGVNSLIPSSTSLTPAQSGAIGQLTQAGQNGNPYAPATSGAVNTLLNGGGATSQIPQVQANLDAYRAQTNPLASNTNYNPYNTPGFSDALDTANSDISNRINGQFAAAGRSGSGMNTQTLARGISQADAQAIEDQYNRNVQNQQSAASNLYGAGNTTAGTIAGMNQNAVTNQNTGINDVGTALTNSIWGPQTALTAQELARSIPASNLGLLAQIGIPLAGLGTSSNGTSTTQNNPSLIQDVATLGGIGSGPATGLGGVKSAGSGLLGLLGML